MVNASVENVEIGWRQLWLPGLERAAPTTVELLGALDSEEDWTENPPGWEGQVWKDAQMFYTVMGLFDFEADRRGWAVTEIRLQRKEDGRVLAIMKASKGKKRIVAFVGGETFYDCWREIQETHRAAGFVWKEDKYAKF